MSPLSRQYWQAASQLKHKCYTVAPKISHVAQKCAESPKLNKLKLLWTARKENFQSKMSGLQKRKSSLVKDARHSEVIIEEAFSIN